MAQQQKKKTEKKSAGTPAVKPVRKPFSGLTSLDEDFPADLQEIWMTRTRRRYSER